MYIHADHECIYQNLKRFQYFSIVIFETALNQHIETNQNDHVLPLIQLVIELGFRQSKVRKVTGFHWLHPLRLTGWG